MDHRRRLISHEDTEVGGFRAGGRGLTAAQAEETVEEEIATYAEPRGHGCLDATEDRRSDIQVGGRRTIRETSQSTSRQYEQIDDGLKRLRGGTYRSEARRYQR